MNMKTEEFKKTPKDDLLDYIDYLEQVQADYETLKKLIETLYHQLKILL